MDNSGHGPLQVPGFGRVSLDQQLEYEARFAHGIGDWVQTPAVTVREFAMVAVMNTITDKPDWHIQIFDDENVKRWHAEAVAAQPLISPNAWAWCVAELRDKAEAWKTHHFIRVLDTGSCICKADAALIPESLRVELASWIDSLRAEHQELGSASLEIDMVDPYLFPLVHGKSRVLSDGGRVYLKDPLSFYAEAKVVPAPYDERTCTSIVQKAIERGEAQKWRWMDGFPAMSPEAYYWSYTFQCLPCEVQFTSESGTDIEITSYINSLHPAKVDVYRSLEKLLSLVIRPWNDCIIKGQEGSNPDTENNRQQRGPVPLRIVTYGAEWDNLLPEWALAFREVSSCDIATDEEYQEALETLSNASKKAAHIEWFEQQDLYWQLNKAHNTKDTYEWPRIKRTCRAPARSYGH